MIECFVNTCLQRGTLKNVPRIPSEMNLSQYDPRYC